MRKQRRSKGKHWQEKVILVAELEFETPTTDHPVRHEFEIAAPILSQHCDVVVYNLFWPCFIKGLLLDGRTTERKE
jgi:hypothetical protein